MKRKLLAVELWALGDLVIATPFLRAAAKEYEVTLLAKPTAIELQRYLWPGVEVITFNMPWTAFRGKYVLSRWPWRSLASLVRQLRSRHFDVAGTARWDPREHALLRLTGAKHRLGFPRLGSGFFLTDSMVRPTAPAHRYDHWRVLGSHLGLDLPPKNEAVVPIRRLGDVLIHSGAGQAIRVWPLARFAFLARQLREMGYSVKVVCDAAQRDWWRARGEEAAAPTTITDLFALLEGAALFVGNDSGPGHLAAILGIPTFTLFGDQLPSFMSPIHPEAEWMPGSDCQYKPCHDYCRFAQPECLLGNGENETWLKLKSFAAKHLKVAPSSP